SFKNVFFSKAFFVVAHFGSDFSRDDNRIAVLVLMHPVSDDSFGFTARVAARPSGIDIGGIDAVETFSSKGIEDFKRLFFVNGPSEDIASEYYRVNLEVGVAQPAFFHV